MVVLFGKCGILGRTNSSIGRILLWGALLMKKYANAWGIACLAAFVTAFFGTLVLLSSEYGRQHFWSISVPAATLAAAFGVLAILGAYMGYKNAKEEDRRQTETDAETEQRRRLLDNQIDKATAGSEDNPLI